MQKAVVIFQIDIISKLIVHGDRQLIRRFLFNIRDETEFLLVFFYKLLIMHTWRFKTSDGFIKYLSAYYKI